MNNKANKAQNGKNDYPKNFGYAVKANGTTAYIVATMTEAIDFAADYLADGEEVRIEALPTPMDWLREEATFEGKDCGYTNDAIIRVAERIKAEREAGNNLGWEA